MKYTYHFDREACWYKQVCGKYSTSECDRGCVRYIKMHFLVTNALLTNKQQGLTKLKPEKIDLKKFSRLNEIKNSIVDFVNTGKNLCIYSNNNGNGKTEWSIKLILRYLSEIWHRDSFTVRAIFINVTRLLNACKDNISTKSDYLKHIKEHIFDCDIVIWDDIGIKGLTSYEHDILYNYINYRIDAGKSNIYTANTIGENFSGMVGDRLYSRIVNCSEIIEFNGSDRRGVL